VQEPCIWFRSGLPKTLWWLLAQDF